MTEDGDSVGIGYLFTDSHANNDHFTQVGVLVSKSLIEEVLELLLHTTCLSGELCYLLKGVRYAVMNEEPLHMGESNPTLSLELYCKINIAFLHSFMHKADNLFSAGKPWMQESKLTVCTKQLLKRRS